MNSPTHYLTKEKAHVFPPVGRCIYCGVLGEKLGREHVLPRAIGGCIIIREACCNCADIIKKFEQPILRDHFGHFRIKNKYKSYHKEIDRQMQKLLLIEEGVVREELLHVDSHPSLLVLPVFKKQPRILSGYSVGGRNVKMGLFLLTKLAPLDADYALPYSFDRDQFCRFLAKIAHGLTIVYSPTESYIPTLQDIILGKSDNYSLYIGANVGEVFGGFLKVYFRLVFVLES